MGQPSHASPAGPAGPDGFWSEEVYSPQQRLTYDRKQIGGAECSVAVLLKRALFPLQPGKLSGVLIDLAPGATTQQVRFAILANFPGVKVVAGESTLVSIRQGLADISISRTSTRWGVPVPWDDDHVFPPDVTIALLDKNVDVVVPLYAQRQPPFNPCIYKSENEDGSYNGYGWVDLEGLDGLLPIASAGAGGLLVRRRVLEAIPEPWFERRGLIGGRPVGRE